MNGGWEWGNQGVDLQDGHLLWYENVGQPSYASGAGSEQSIHDFLEQGPSVEGVPDDVISALRQALIQGS